MSDNNPTAPPGEGQAPVNNQSGVHGPAVVVSGATPPDSPRGVLGFVITNSTKRDNVEEDDKSEAEGRVSDVKKDTNDNKEDAVKDESAEDKDSPVTEMTKETVKTNLDDEDKTSSAAEEGAIVEAAAAAAGDNKDDKTTEETAVKSNGEVTEETHKHSGRTPIWGVEVSRGVTPVWLGDDHSEGFVENMDHYEQEHSDDHPNVMLESQYLDETDNDDVNDGDFQADETDDADDEVDESDGDDEEELTPKPE